MYATNFQNIFFNQFVFYTQNLPNESFFKYSTNVYLLLEIAFIWLLLDLEYNFMYKNNLKKF